MPTRTVLSKANPKVSVIIPSLDGYRNGNVGKLVNQIKNQTFKDIEIILVIGEMPNGHARNVGVEKAKGDLFVFMDDDAILGDNRVIENLIKTFSIDDRIGMVGASTLVPEDSNWFQRWLAKEEPRATYARVDKVTETKEGATHLCCAFPQRVYERVGGESDILITGTDLDMRHRIRKAGYKIVLASNCWVYHPLPSNLVQAVKNWWWYGTGSHIFAVTNPDMAKVRNFRSKAHAFLFIVFMMLFFFVNIILSLDENRKIRLRFKPLMALKGLILSLGYVAGWAKAIKGEEPLNIWKEIDSKLRR